ncbi:3-methyladenine DNA glycosylase AlkD [Kineococcus xinjiangensis]|uniref:3-methyladenine DNA glycosylase AlkD n=1 Tax=Kineococcus xinjiangensis TaxID=512762 RepID=A0A2S6ITF5_9ACTN|nr:DNA alkylation repair protein [Kineococcus xinjiangensis]PPK97460.1 3-methyladenine DNA glycosylase AlkD [Kineococcus xinjiangensis]
MSWSGPVTAGLGARLEEAADQRTREHWTGYLKGAAHFRGVPMAGVRSAVRALWRQHDLGARPTGELLALAHEWFAAPWTEDKLAAVLLLAEHLVPRLELPDLPALAVPLVEGDVADWNVCDWYATKALHAFAVSRPGEVEARVRGLAAWCSAEGLWQRRAGLVALVRLAPGGEEVFPGFPGLLLGACAANLVDDDRFAHTGPGWVLRELSKAEPEAVAAFVAAHPELSREARRMATAHLRPGPYRRR